MSSVHNNGYVFDYRDAGESERLDWQHGILRKLTGLIPPFIDTDSLENMADVCTGTG